MTLLVWALLTGVITGGVMLTIFLWHKQPRATELPPDELTDLRLRVDALEQAERRLADVEERLDFAERMLTKQRDAQRLPG